MTQHEPDNQGANALDLAPWTSPVQERPEKKPKRASRRPPSSYADIFTAVIAAIAAIVGVCALVIYDGQLGAMESTLVATEIAANATRESAETAKQSLVAYSRGWIMPEGFRPERLVADRPGQYVALALKNYGGGPARKIKTRYGIDVVPFDSACPTIANREVEGEGSLGPGQIAPINVRVPLDQATVAAIDNQVGKLCLAFSVTYESAVGGPGDTSFCVSYLPVVDPPAFPSCPSGVIAR